MVSFLLTLIYEHLVRFGGKNKVFIQLNLDFSRHLKTFLSRSEDISILCVWGGRMCKEKHDFVLCCFIKPFFFSSYRRLIFSNQIRLSHELLFLKKSTNTPDSHYDISFLCLYSTDLIDYIF